jgi:hypothetical protein
LIPDRPEILRMLGKNGSISLNGGSIVFIHTSMLFNLWRKQMKNSIAILILLFLFFGSTNVYSLGIKKDSSTKKGILALSKAERIKMFWNNSKNDKKKFFELMNNYYEKTTESSSTSYPFSIFKSENLKRKCFVIDDEATLTTISVLGGCIENNYQELNDTNKIYVKYFSVLYKTLYLSNGLPLDLISKDFNEPKENVFYQKINKLFDKFDFINDSLARYYDDMYKYEVELFEHEKLSDYDKKQNEGSLRYDKNHLGKYLEWTEMRRFTINDGHSVKLNEGRSSV